MECIKQGDYVKCIKRESEFKDCLGVVDSIEGITYKMKFINEKEVKSFYSNDLQKTFIDISKYKINYFSSTSGFGGKTEDHSTLEDALERYKEFFWSHNLMNVISINYSIDDKNFNTRLLHTKEDDNRFNHPEITYNDLLKSEIQFSKEMDDIIRTITKWKHENNIF